MYVNQLDKRYLYSSYGYYGYGYNSRWSSWGRWVLLGVILVAGVFCLFICMCFARRRRRAGAKPMYGTGWMAPGGNANQTYPMTGNYNNNQPGGYNQGGYNQGGYNQQQQYGNYQAPPTYGQPQTQQYTGSTFNPNDGYYGQPQQPQNTYNREAGDFAPPTGPPPAKN